MATATWLLQSTSTPTASSSSNEAVGTVPFERRGIVTPFRRDLKSDFANDTDAEVIRSNVQQILGTRCRNGNTPGELPWFGEFGSLLHLLRHQNVKPVLKYQARAYVVDALSRWEPRVRVVRVQVNQTQRTIVVRTAFVIVEGFSVGRVDELFEVETVIQRAA